MEAAARARRRQLGIGSIDHAVAVAVGGVEQALAGSLVFGKGHLPVLVGVEHAEPHVCLAVFALVQFGHARVDASPVFGRVFAAIQQAIVVAVAAGELRGTVFVVFGTAHLAVAVGVVQREETFGRMAGGHGQQTGAAPGAVRHRLVGLSAAFGQCTLAALPGLFAGRVEFATRDGAVLVGVQRVEAHIGLLHLRGGFACQLCMQAVGEFLHVFGFAQCAVVVAVGGIEARAAELLEFGPRHAAIAVGVELGDEGLHVVAVSADLRLGRHRLGNARG